MEINLSSFKKPTLLVLYVLIFVFALTSAIPAYVNSSFLKSLTNEQLVGVFYTMASILAFASLIFIPKILQKYGNYRVTLSLIFLYFLNFLGLAYVQNVFLVLFFFVITSSMATTIYFNLDMFLEHNSSDLVTGRIRSVYLTFLNLAWLGSPLLAGIIVGEYSYRMIYLVAALILIPAFFIVFSSFSDFKDPDYIVVNFLETLKNININKNIRNIWVSSFLLQLFYSWMVIYTPIYLNVYIGFSWGTIGILFSLMLIPFILIQIPAGYLADKMFGEKEILVAGFLIMGIYTAMMPFITSKNFIIWAVILFSTRIGAAMVEVMNDTYFFKNVSEKDSNQISLYRTSAPLAYIISPVIATVIIYFFPISNLFFILGLIMMFGVKYSLAIEDTK